MKLYPLEPGSKLAQKIAGVSKRLQMDVLISNVNVGDLDTLVVIGNGTPDDIAFSVVAFKSKVDQSALIVKPKTERRYGFTNMIPLYLKNNVRKILILMDQEDDTINTIYERIQKPVEDLATGEIEVIDDETNGRVRIYKGKYGSKAFEIILIINGLDDTFTDKHSIEDHLMNVAEEISIGVGAFGNSKAAWRSLDNNQQLEIFKKLKNSRRLVESVFPQQIIGCQCLEKSTEESSG